LLGKSFVRCNSLGASSCDVGAADPSQEVMSEAMGGGEFGEITVIKKTRIREVS